MQNELACFVNALPDTNQKLAIHSSCIDDMLSSERFEGHHDLTKSSNRLDTMRTPSKEKLLEVVTP